MFNSVTIGLEYLIHILSHTSSQVVHNLTKILLIIL